MTARPVRQAQGSGFDVASLMKQALRCGVSVAEFWEMTPRETLLTIEAAIWIDRRRVRQDLSLAWHTAALSRVKRMPSLKRLLASSKGSDKARPLKGKELEKRRDEFETLTEKVDVDVLAKRVKK